MDDLLQEFLAEVGASAAAFDGIALERSPMDPARLRELTALFHTIRGTCRFLELPRLGALASAAESFLESVPKRAEPPAVAPALEALKRVLSLLAALEETGREPQGNDASLLAALARGGASAPEPEVAPALPVATATADRLDGGSVGPPADREMPVETGALADEIASLVLARNRLAHLVNRSYRPDIASALERLTQATDALRNTVGQLRLTRFEACWPSLVRDAADAAAAQGRAVGFLLDGGHLPVERDLLDAIREPLGRVIAHAAAKAIETPETRRAAGKPERAAIRVSVERDERVLRVAVADDGAGRGLGREVDTSSLVALGGAREVSALLGRGTTVRLRVPLPKTVEPAFVLACGDLPFLVPQVHVRELLVPPQDGTAGIEIVGDGSDLLLPGRRLPLVRLDALVSDETAAGVPSVVAVVEAKGAVFALSAEAVAESQDVVVAPLSPFLRDIPFLSGAALLGDGRSALMLDVDALAAAVPRAEGSVLRSAPASGETMDLLRFQDAGDTPMAIPVAVLARLESVEPSQLDYLDGRPLLRSPTGPIPLLAMNGMPKVSEGAHPVLIVAAKDRPIGLVVDRILDIQRGLVIRGETGQGPGIFGSALLGGRRTSVVDAGYLTSLA